MHCRELLLLLGVLCLSLVNGQQNSPHRKCTFSNRTRIQICTGDVFAIPGNFDMQQIHQQAVGIQIASDSSSSGKGEIQLKQGGHVDQVPASLRLRFVSLRGFRFVNQTRLPIREMFYNVRDHIQRLMIQDSEIGYLDGEFLKDFHALDTLWLDNNDIATVDKDTFKDCCRKLKTLNLNGNRLEYFHWSTFAPVAPHLKEILMRRQAPGGQQRTSGLRLLPHEVNFTLPSIEIVDLAQNELDRMPSEVLATFNISRLRLFNLTYNSFCVDELTCTCCKLKPLADWMQRVAHFQGNHGVLLAFHCGTNNNLWSFDSSKPPVTHSFPGIVDKCDANIKFNLPMDVLSRQRVPGSTTDLACAYMTPIRASCSGNKMRLVYDMHDYETIRADFDADRTQECRTLMEEVHSEALMVAGITLDIHDTRPVEEVIISCRKGKVTVSHHNAQQSQAKRIRFNGEPNLVCINHLTKFLEKLNELYLQQNQEEAQLPVLKGEYFYKEELCSASPPLKFICKVGRMTLPTDRQFNISNAVKMEYTGDESFKCREHVQNMHKWLIEKHTPLLSTTNSTVSVGPDTVEVICHQGRFGLSTLEPETSAATKLVYYTRASPKCREAFVEFLIYAAALR